MNKIMLIGRIATDLDLRMTETGKKVLSFNLAVDRTTKDKNGNYPTDFIKCTAWEYTAEYLNKYAQKGVKIAVEGKLEINAYTSKDGNKVKDANVSVEHGEILEWKKENASVKEIRISKENVNGGSTTDVTVDDLEFY